jgi:hypothetical protein
VWKGPKRETLEVSTPSQGSACGYSFSEGRKHLVYAEGKRMSVDGCGETTPLSKASADFEALGNGETLGGAGVLSDTSGGFSSAWDYWDDGATGGGGVVGGPDAVGRTS